MAAIHLKHPLHGHKVAYHEAEANSDASHGWERFDPDAVTEDPAPKKRGRPPAAAAEELPSFLKPKE